jgi:NarL family two-component system response regulator YdfI
MTPIRILVTDDHLVVREGLRLILETAEDFLLVGEAADGAECLRLVTSLNPDVVLMDLQMPGMDGITAIGHLSREHPDVAIVILTTFNEDELMLQGLRAGARGYLLKDTDRQTLLNTIIAAARGETLLSPDILSRVLALQHGPDNVDNASNNASPLTDRELEIMRAVAQGKRNKEIAYELGISERTVKAHLSSIFSKFDVDSRAAAVAVASQDGLLG